MNHKVELLSIFSGAYHYQQLLGTSSGSAPPDSFELGPETHEEYERAAWTSPTQEYLSTCPRRGLGWFSNYASMDWSLM